MADTSSPHDAVFDVSVQRLAEVYGQAALDAAGDKGGQFALAAEFEALNGLLRKQPRLEELFASRLISPDEKLAMIERIFGKSLSAGMLNTLRVMTKHGRLDLVRPVARAVHALWEERSNRISVEVRTAYPMDAKLEEEIRQTLAKLLQGEAILVKKVEPDLLGGFIIRAGDRVYDASVRSQLERVRVAMVSGAIEAIQTRPEQFVDGLSV